MPRFPPRLRFRFVAALLLGSGAMGQGQTPPPATKADLPALVRQLEIRSIARWGDEVVIETDFHNRHEVATPPRFWRLAEDADAFTRFEPGAGKRFLGFSENG